MEQNPRLTQPSLRVLARMLNDPMREMSGADLRRDVGIASGTLYPILFRFEEAGWLKSRWEEVEPRDAGRPRRRLYLLTGAGQVHARTALAGIGFIGAMQWA